MRSHFIFLLLTIGALALNACTTLEPAPTAPGEADFANTVKPLIEHRCAWCHNNEKPNAGLNFEDRATVLNPGSRFVVPGEPGRSRIYTAVTRDPDHMKVMPFDGWGITAEQKRALHDWIAAGAPWPAGKKGQLRKKDYRVEMDDYL